MESLLQEGYKLIEGVQRRATKLVAGMQDFNYNDRLKILGLQRLEERRMRSDLIETFKIVNRKYDINPELFFQLDEGDRRGHDQKLFKKRFRLNVRKYAFQIELLIIGICLKLATRCPVSGCWPSCCHCYSS